MTQTPGFLRHVALLLWLRLATAGRGAILPFAAAAAPALPLFLGAYHLLTTPAIAGAPMWTRLLLALAGFVSGCVWAAWPLLSATVGDHAEVARFRAFPIAPQRLLVASLAADLLAPLALVVFAPCAGAVAGFLRAHPHAPAAPAVALLLGHLALCAAWARVVLYSVIGVLRRQRGAEAASLFFVVVIAIALVLPPLDTSWLRAIASDAPVTTLRSELVANAARALSRVPTGYLAAGLMNPALAPLLVAMQATLALAGLLVARHLLLRAVRRTPAAAGPRRSRAAANPFAATRTAFTTLLARDALDLWRNPRARLLVFVPFVLAAALRLVGARDLALYRFGPAADAYALGTLSLYAAAVFASSFAHNAFGYDGRGLACLLAAPLDPARVLLARNLVHGGAATALGLASGAFYVVCFRAGSLHAFGAAALGVLALVPTMLAAGNFLSLLFPQRLDTNMERRADPPLAVAVLGMAAAALGAAPWALHHPALGAAAALAAWAALLRPAIALLRRRAERVLTAIA